ILLVAAANVLKSSSRLKNVRASCNISEPSSSSDFVSSLELNGFHKPPQTTPPTPPPAATPEFFKKLRRETSSSSLSESAFYLFLSLPLFSLHIYNSP